MIVPVKPVLKTINASLRIIPTEQPNNFGNGNCIQIERFRVTCLNALKTKLSK